MSAMTTFMPAPRRALAMPSPMPLAPPVTNAVLPGRFCMVRFPLAFGGGARPTKRWTNRRKSYCIEHIQSGACRVQPTEGRAMVADVPGAIGRVAEVAPGVQGWPARSVAYYGLTVIILATALNFLDTRSEEHSSEHQSQSNLVCRLLHEKQIKKNKTIYIIRT